jgi:signal peptidase I
MKNVSIPSADDLERELNREKYKQQYHRTLKSTMYALITAAAAAVLVATLWLPVLQIYGSSMTPTLVEGQIVLSVKSDNPQPGDIVAFYYGNKVLVKRYIAGPGEWVDIHEDGTVTVNGSVLEEPYLTEKALGICDLEFPYQVPEGRHFLMGDERTLSVDSRHSSVGCITKENMVGKIVFCIWPMNSFGFIS